MKHFATLLLIAMVAIATTECVGKYLLVEVEDGDIGGTENKEKSRSLLDKLLMTPCLTPPWC